MNTMPQNKELKLTKPSQDGASQLNSVFDGLYRRPRGPDARPWQMPSQSRFGSWRC